MPYPSIAMLVICTIKKEAGVEAKANQSRDSLAPHPQTFNLRPS